MELLTVIQLRNILFALSTNVYRISNITKKQEHHILFNNSFTALNVMDFKFLEQDTGKPKKLTHFCQRFRRKYCLHFQSQSCR